MIAHIRPADLVAFARDPREDPTALAEPVLIMVNGRSVAGRARAGSGE